MVGSFRFPRTARLRKSPEFAAVSREGARVARSHFTVLHRANGLGRPRLGVAVSRKVGGSVVRNRVKRWLREAMRHERAQLPAVDVVLIARPSAATAGASVLRADVAEAFRRVARSVS